MPAKELLAKAASVGREIAVMVNQPLHMIRSSLTILRDAAGRDRGASSGARLI